MIGHIFVVWSEKSNYNITLYHHHHIISTNAHNKQIIWQDIDVSKSLNLSVDRAPPSLAEMTQYTTRVCKVRR